MASSRFRSRLFSSLVLLTLVSARASAQNAPAPEAPTPAPSETNQPSGVKAAPNSPALPQPREAAQPPISVSEKTTCLLAAHEGIDAADAQTAHRLVCEQVARALVSGGTPAPRYEVQLGKLGSKVILSLRAADAEGNIRDERHLELANIEEVSVAAARVATALVQDTPIESTQRVDNVVGAEARPRKANAGALHFGIGLVGAMPANRLQAPSPGLEMGLAYQSGQWGAGIKLRGAGGGDESGNLGYFSLAAGGRFFTSDADIAPFVGAGLGWTALWLNTNEASEFVGHGTGIAVHGEVGVQFLRTHKSHFDVALRADAPLFTLRSSRPQDSGKSYIVPLTLNATFYF